MILDSGVRIGSDSPASQHRLPRDLPARERQGTSFHTPRASVRAAKGAVQSSGPSRRDSAPAFSDPGGTGVTKSGITAHVPEASLSKIAAGACQRL